MDEIAGSRFEHCYRAVVGRDARFDGAFVTAVTSTGVYCRPSCPARTPARANVRFFRSAAVAGAAGFRACRRCRPDAALGSRQVAPRSDVVARAVELIAEGVVDGAGVAGLAHQLGYSERHLTRLLRAEVGAGPLALARAQRVRSARTLIATTALPFVEVAAVAGFASVRQFNDAVRRSTGRTPTQLRSASAGQLAGRSETPDAQPLNAQPVEPQTRDPLTRDPLTRDPLTRAPDRRPPDRRPPETLLLDPLTVRLPARAPLDVASTVAFLAARAVPGVEAAGSDGSYRRTLRLPCGPALVHVHPPAAGPDRPAQTRTTVRCTLQLADLRDLAAAVRSCRRLLDLDVDPAAVAAVLTADPLLAPLVAVAPGRRLPAAADPVEAALRAVLGQQVSVAAARTLAARLVARHGEALDARVALPGQPGGGDPGGPWKLFPSAQVLAGVDPATLPLPRSRAVALQALAAALADGRIRLDGGPGGQVDRDEQRRRLLALPGIGPWTAELIALRALGDPDAFPAGDLALSRALQQLGGPTDPLESARRAERWRPWRGYAVAHLWASLATTPPPSPRQPVLAGGRS